MQRANVAFKPKRRFCVLLFFGGFMDFLISRLENLNVAPADEIVADCVDFGRLHWLVDYINARERLHDMEVDTYVR